MKLSYSIIIFKLHIGRMSYQITKQTNKLASFNKYRMETCKDYSFSSENALYSEPMSYTIWVHLYFTFYLK